MSPRTASTHSATPSTFGSSPPPVRPPASVPWQNARRWIPWRSSERSARSAGTEGRGCTSARPTGSSTPTSDRTEGGMVSNLVLIRKWPDGKDSQGEEERKEDGFPANSQSPHLLLSLFNSFSGWQLASRDPLSRARLLGDLLDRPEAGGDPIGLRRVDADVD